MIKPNLKEEKLWVVGSVIVGFAASVFLYLNGESNKKEIFELGLLFSFLLWFATVIKRALRGDLKKGLLNTLAKTIIICGAVAGLTSLALMGLGVID